MIIKVVDRNENHLFHFVSESVPRDSALLTDKGRTYRVLSQEWQLRLPDVDGSTMRYPFCVELCVVEIGVPPDMDKPQEACND